MKLMTTKTEIKRLKKRIKELEASRDALAFIAKARGWKNGSAKETC
jgi:hypothetical protein